MDAIRDKQFAANLPLDDAGATGVAAYLRRRTAYDWVFLALILAGDVYVLRRFNKRYFQPAFFQVFRHFHADKAAADDDRPPAFFAVDKGLDPVGIGNIAQRKNTAAVDAGQVGADRFCARR